MSSFTSGFSREIAKIANAYENRRNAFVLEDIKYELKELYRRFHETMQFTPINSSLCKSLEQEVMILMEGSYASRTSVKTAKVLGASQIFLEVLFRIDTSQIKITFTPNIISGDVVFREERLS